MNTIPKIKNMNLISCCNGGSINYRTSHHLNLLTGDENMFKFKFFSLY